MIKETLREEIIRIMEDAGFKLSGEKQFINTEYGRIHIAEYSYRALVLSLLSHGKRLKADEIKTRLYINDHDSVQRH